MSTGWICPKCGRALAPWVSSCPCYLENLQITCTQTGTAVGNTSNGKCSLICDNKTDLGYCKTTVCIRQKFDGDSNYGIRNRA